MTTTQNDPDEGPDRHRVLVIGDVVYRPFSPQSVGKVIAILPPAPIPDHIKHNIWYGPSARLLDPNSREYQKVRVKWLKKGNPTTDERASGLYTVADLIYVTERKLAGHKNRLARAEKEL